MSGTRDEVLAKALRDSGAYAQIKQHEAHTGTSRGFWLVLGLILPKDTTKARRQEYKQVKNTLRELMPDNTLHFLLWPVVWMRVRQHSLIIRVSYKR